MFHVLGIETSCDETSAAVTRFENRSGTLHGLELLSDVTARQEEVHQRFGGVVPELASRKHLESLLPVVRMALEKASVDYSQLDAVAVTNRPGLIGALMVGVNAAKAISYSQEIPLIAINHLEAHLGAVLLENPTLEFPAVGLIVSGGHTSLYALNPAWENFAPLAHTRDDAAGEAFDKGARLLGLPYPGGPEIARLAENGNAAAIDFPRALPGKTQKDFSFSGLKTAMSYYLRDNPLSGPEKLPDICASYQEAIVDALVEKTKNSLREFGTCKTFVIAGGVAANSRLRVKMRKMLPKETALIVPSPKFCTDNGAMIAALGALRFCQGNVIPSDAIFSVEVSPRTEAKNARGPSR